MDGTEKVSIDPASTVSLCDTMEAPGQGPGGGKPQLSGNEYDQPGQSALHVGNSADLDPFSRASKVPRTPPDTQKVAPIFMGSNLGKRKADVSETGTISGSAAKKNRVEYETRLMVEIKKLNELILAQPKIKTEIKDTAAKLVPLVRLAFIEAHRPETLHQAQPTTTAETSEAGTQTVTPEEMKAANIRRDFCTRPLDELVASDWPGCIYEATSISRGGISKAKEGTARVIMALSEKLESDPHLQRLALDFPLVKSLNQKSLPGGKLATLRCEEAISIDGKEQNNGGQTIIVCSLAASQNQDVKDAADQLVAKCQLLNATKLQIGLPDTIDTTRTRKILEIAFANSGITAEICASKSQRQAFANHTGSRGKQLMNSTLILRTNEGVSFTDIVKDLKNDLHPDAFSGRGKNERVRASTIK